MGLPSTKRTDPPSISNRGLSEPVTRQSLRSGATSGHGRAASSACTEPVVIEGVDDDGMCEINGRSEARILPRPREAVARHRLRSLLGHRVDTRADLVEHEDRCVGQHRELDTSGGPSATLTSSNLITQRQAIVTARNDNVPLRQPTDDQREDAGDECAPSAALTNDGGSQLALRERTGRIRPARMSDNVGTADNPRGSRDSSPPQGAAGLMPMEEQRPPPHRLGGVPTCRGRQRR